MQSMKRHNPSPDNTRATNYAVMHRVLSIAEIQDRIFSFNGVRDAARCTRVCRAWKEVGLDHTWNTVYCLHDLFKILGPMKAPKQGEYVFARPLSPSDWEIFFKIAKRVRILNILEDSDSIRKPEVMEGNILAVLHSAPRTPILPNIVELEYQGGLSSTWLRVSVYFLHPGLRALSVKFTRDTIEDMDVLRTFFNEVSSRAPALKSVSVVAFSVIITEDVLSSSFLKMKSLERIAVSSATSTTSTLASVSNLPELRELYVNPLIWREGDDILDLSSESSGNKFHSIQYLSLRGQIKSVSALFVCKLNNFRDLRTFILDMSRIADGTDINQFITFLSASCTALSHVEFTDSYPRSGRCYFDGGRTSWSINLLSPLKSLDFLHSLIIDYTRPVLATNDELVEFIIGCKRLESFHLNPNPELTLRDDEAQLAKLIPSFEVLPRILDCRPNMKKLSLFLYASGIDFLSVHSPVSTLKSLDLGWSYFDELDDAAFFLSQFLPHDCTFKVHNYKLADKFQAVKEMFPHFLKFRNEDKSRIRELEDEVHRLKRLIGDSSTQSGNDESLDRKNEVDGQEGE